MLSIPTALLLGAVLSLCLGDFFPSDRFIEFIRVRYGIYSSFRTGVKTSICSVQHPFQGTCYHLQFTRRPQGFRTFYSTTQIRLAITSSQLKFSLCKLLLRNSSQYGCHSVAVASPANFREFPSRLLNNITTLLNHNWKSTWSLTELYEYCVVGVGKNVSRNLRSSWPFCP